MAKYECKYTIKKEIEADSEEKAREIFENELEDRFFCIISSSDVEVKPTKGD